ncbi:hypothetical protein D3C73_1007770 [compost metagenome]
MHGRLERQAAIERRSKHADKAVAGRCRVLYIDRQSRDPDFISIDTGFRTVSTQSSQNAGAKAGRERCGGCSAAEPTGQRLGLIFVDDDKAAERQYLFGQREGRSEVEDRQGLRGTCAADQLFHFRHIVFHLHQHDICPLQQVLFHGIRRRGKIGASRNNNHIVALGIDMDRGIAGGLAHARNAADISRRCKSLKADFGKAVRSDSSDHHHLGTIARCRQRLIGALAAGFRAKTLGKQGLARLRHLLDLVDEVDVDGAEGDDHNMSSFRRPERSGLRRLLHRCVWAERNRRRGKGS